MQQLYVYTAIIGGFNDTLAPVGIQPDRLGRIARFVCFSESIRQAPSGWEIRPLRYRGRNARLTARWHKIMSHEVLREAPVTLWHDGSHHLTVNPWQVIDRCLSRTTTFASFKHPDRNCVYDEVQACLERQKDIPDRLRLQAESYRRDSFPAHYGLIETSCVARVNSSKVRQLNEAWWQQVSYWSCRDQVSLPYVLWRTSFRQLGCIPGCRDKSPYFSFRPHR